MVHLRRRGGTLCAWSHLPNCIMRFSSHVIPGCPLSCFRASFSFWFIHNHLCIDHYCAPLAIFFSPLDAHFPLSIVNVHNLAMYASHNDYSARCYIDLGSSSLPHIIAIASMSLVNFLTNDYFLVLGLLCYCWTSFCSLRSYLRRVFFPLFFVDCLLSFFFSSGCVYLCSYLPCTFDRWIHILDFLYTGIFSFSYAHGHILHSRQ
jgi:hypothetical protein